MYFFDEQFVEIMRQELDIPNLDIVWRPELRRLCVHPRDTEQFWFQPGEYGCWAVMMTVNECTQSVLADGSALIHSKPVEYMVYALDGNHGWPLTPGRWVTENLLASDRARHGKDRLVQTDEWREGKVKMAQKQRDTFAWERARDPLLYNAMKKEIERIGTENALREELVEYERQAVEDMQRSSDLDLFDRKQARMHTGKRLDW